MKQLKNSPAWFWFKIVFWNVLFVYFIVLNIAQPEGDIKWTWHWGIWLPLTTYVVLWEGRTYFKIYKQMLRKDFNMNTLVGLSSHVLFVYSVVMVGLKWDKPMYSYDVMWEGAGVLILFTNIGHYIQDKITSNSLETYNKLNEMKNATIQVKRGNEFISVKSKEVNIGDTILIKRGEFVSLDGTLLSDGLFDYSNITGESREIKLAKNETVTSGCFNIGDNILLRVTRTPEESTVNHIIEKIEDVSLTRPKMQQFADKILRIFTPSVVIIALLTFTTYMLIGYVGDYRFPWVGKGHPYWEIAIEAAVATMAIACPCALGIATPSVYTVSSMLAANHGLVINEPKALEEINKIEIIAFDKTGTITSDEMQVAKIHGNKKYLGVASALEQNVEHSIAKAIFAQAKPVPVSNIKYMDNKGISGEWNNKKVSISRYVGNEFNVSQSNTNIALYIDNEPVLVFELENQIKEGVHETIKLFKKLKIKTVMITGDNDEVAQHIAKQIEIDQVFSNVSPVEKADIIKTLQNEGKVAFVGDGFNDAIAAKQANLSIAFNSGSDITNSLSDISIVSGDFYEILNFFKLGKLNNSKVKLAMIYAFTFNIIAFPIAMLMFISPWMAAAIMAISDILVAGNSLYYKITGQRKLRRVDMGENSGAKQSVKYNRVRK